MFSYAFISLQLQVNASMNKSTYKLLSVAIYGLSIWISI